jgi:hypothetical protein
VIDISAQIDLKIKACGCYQSQGLHEGGSITDMVRTINAYFGGRIETKYAEPFFTYEVLGFGGLDQLI